MAVPLTGVLGAVLELRRIGLHDASVLEKQQPFLAGRHGKHERFRFIERGTQPSRDVTCALE